MHPGRNKPEFVPPTGHITFTLVACTNEMLNGRETSSESRPFHQVLNGGSLTSESSRTTYYAVGKCISLDSGDPV